MPITETLSILTAPLTPNVGFMFMLIGLYSLTLNVMDARHKNHPRAERVARTGGWFYIVVGAAIVMQKFF